MWKIYKYNKVSVVIIYAFYKWIYLSFDNFIEILNQMIFLMKVRTVYNMKLFLCC